MQGLHFLFLFCILSFVFQKKIDPSKSLLVIIFVGLLIFNYKRYFYKVTFTDLNVLWKDERNSTKNGYLLMLYILFNLILTLSMSAYIGSMKNWEIIKIF